jgi:GNAT superfamily N-acetyltransferase
MSAVQPVAAAPVLRRATADDAFAAGSICYAAFRAIADQHGFPPDFPQPGVAIELMRRVIGQADIFGVVAEVEGRVVGSNFLWKDDAVAGIGPITIDPAAQNRGVGRRLMEAVIENAQTSGIDAVRLVQAAYHGRSLSLYYKLGFDAREPLTVFQGKPLMQPIEGFEVRVANDANLEDADLLCRRVHGHARARELRSAILSGKARVVVRGGRITGYTTGIGFFGHSIGETTADLQALICAADCFEGPGFIVPTRDAELMRWCLRQGLRIVQPMTLMSIGSYQQPNGPFLPSVLY